MTALNKHALREAAEKATPGEWKRMMRNSDELMTTFHGVAIGNVFVELTTGKRDIFDAEFIAAANPSTVLSLLDELEAAEKRIAEQREYYEGVIADGSRRIAELERYRAAFTEQNDKTEWVQHDKRFAVVRPLGKHRADVLREYIEHLEAREFKVEMPDSFYPDGDIDAPLAVDELEVIAAIVEAGGKPVAFCKRCDREIDLTHRPDGSHYCHAPDAGIVVKGD
ncbi:ead/Ea22-like family protein [Citrobacter braakii]|uniref:ead/Ea22-like family protein n=1 Tax=Citrobacter braakii TaxID=57706 RepID=UPI00351D1B50